MPDGPNNEKVTLTAEQRAYSEYLTYANKVCKKYENKVCKILGMAT